jgi:DNA-binding response OmpR family regulator
MRKILLVEDEPSLRDVYSLILGTEPYDLHVAVNGKEALEKCAEVTYDLILLDLMMPVVDGVGFLEGFSASGGSLETTKVIILSNLSSGQELTKALNFGVQKSILKSDLSPRQLLAAVRYELGA